MGAKQKVRLTVDLGMTVLLPLLMAYSLVGEMAHEWLGIAMAALFILHHLLALLGHIIASLTQRKIKKELSSWNM